MEKPVMRVFLSITVLALAALSCSNAAWVLSNLCTGSGGTWVQVPNDPSGGYCSTNKSAVTDHQKEETTSIQPDQDSERADANPVLAESDRPAEEAEAQVDPHNEAAQTIPNNPASHKYIGSTSIASTWVDNWGGQTIIDEITIYIDPQGNVSGALLSIWESGKSDPIEWEDGSCVTEATRTVTADLTGKLTEQNHTIQMQFTHVNEIQRYGCPAGNETLSDSWTSEAQVLISGNKITGSTPDGITFEAIRQ